MLEKKKCQLAAHGLHILVVGNIIQDEPPQILKNFHSLYDLLPIVCCEHMLKCFLGM
jgi:hypothetical protein